MMNTTDQFEKDVIEGLSLPQKKISSKYFYDEIGDKIFQEIMQLDEYYLPKAELEILQNESEKVASYLPEKSFDMLELGAGDGSKTVHFLKQMVDLGKEFRYLPFDISEEVLSTNTRQIKCHMPSLPIQPVSGDYFKRPHLTPCGDVYGQEYRQL